MKTFSLQEDGNPRPEACREVARILRVAVERYPAMELDMQECSVQNKWHECGTVHCHAGAFLLGSEEKIGADESYLYGVKLMGKVLGFSISFLPGMNVEYWAYNNPDLWGNAQGISMLSSRIAFNGAKNVSDIADWWDAVADRIQAHNEKGGLSE